MEKLMILLANLDVRVEENLIYFLQDVLGAGAIFTSIENTAQESIADHEMYDYFFIEAGRLGIVDGDLLKDIIGKKKAKAQVIVFTVSDNFGLTADSFFKNFGVEKILRMPVSCEKIREIISK